MRFGPDEKDDFYDLASILSSDLRLCAMHMCSTPRSPSTASPARARSWQPELTRRALLARPDAALYLCKHPGHVSLVRLLHEHNASLDHPAVTSKGKPVLAPLHAAAAQYHTNVVRYMLDNGVEIKQPREGFHPYDTMTTRTLPARQERLLCGWRAAAAMRARCSSCSPGELYWIQLMTLR